METYRHNLTSCPQCRHELDAATKVTGNAGGPDPGDLTVCLNCGTILQFTPALALERASRETLSDFLQKEPNNFIMLMRAKKGIDYINRQRARMRHTWN
ncbi:MAG TPA: hypothetical protein VL498_07035 [Terracidiphilus sp.]|jgi:hypothetical protein|nr:hypothetical protein [Terracidiphilus sp.]